MMNGVGARVLLALGAILLVSAPASTQERKSGITAMAGMQPGLWRIRQLDVPAAPPRDICIANPQTLMQIEHRTVPCARLVIANEAKSATVHYTCPSGGFGRTTMKVENPRLVRLDTQGIAGNAPFAYEVEARRIGSCP